MTILHIACGEKVPAGVDVDVSFIPAELWAESAPLRYIVEYGFKQSLNDAIASPDWKGKPELARAQVLKRLDAIMAGSVRAIGTRETSDPVAAEAFRIAAQWWKDTDDQARKTKLTTVMRAHNMDEKTAKKAILTAYAKLDDVRARAAENIHNRKAPVVDVDLAELGLV